MLWFAYRVYAVTGRNEFTGGLLALLIVVQFYRGFFRSSGSDRTHVSLSRLIARVRDIVQLPDINSDVLRFCVQIRWRFVESM